MQLVAKLRKNKKLYSFSTLILFITKGFSLLSHIYMNNF